MQYVRLMSTFKQALCGILTLTSRMCTYAGTTLEILPILHELCQLLGHYVFVDCAVGRSTVHEVGRRSIWTT